MNRKILFFLSLVALFLSVNAQEPGRVVIRNSNPGYPGFIASLNGVRLSNIYNPVAEFNYLEDRNYRVKILQAGSSNALSFVINSAPQYISVYMLDKDNKGNYSLVLESKVLMGPGDMSSPAAVETSSIVATPMPNAAYNDMLQSVKKESIESTRLEMAKTFFYNQNLSSAQVLGIVKLFSFEDSKINFAKFAYSRTIDKSNYYKVFDAFSFSGSKKDLSEYMKNNP